MSKPQSQGRLRKLLIFDGNNMIRRMESIKSFQRLSYKGQPTGIIHASVDAILRDIDASQPDEVAVVFDGLGVKEIKQRVYAGYKANRSSMIDATAGQMQITKEILRAAGIYCYQEPGHDADDIIGTFARMYMRDTSIEPRSVLIRSNDKDFAQLVNKVTALWKPNGEMWYTENVRWHFGVQKPAHVADYLAIVGDGVDGIPGLPNIGPVKAKEMLVHGGIEDIIEHYDGPNRKVLDDNVDNLRKFYALTKINTRMLSPAALREIVPKLTPQPYNKRLWQLLHHNGLWKIMNRLKLSTSVLAEKGGIFG